ncbi:CRISPR-associated endonuclease Cas3'' [Chondromyces apiculatus]|uniref:CRISPR-associated helicase Cas3 n=1 Tax=Chondromyces apiculatus DSM 436 TaxID=1192034 RepID=A0A017T7X6_9BACT|nr:CRISPR-associated endonuclease Cas3'' [Chondromyces apiculatus]EYF05349.1 CRISPR-associated helicase Cas3 [Chondromyces apiculatus DSM 436]
MTSSTSSPRSSAALPARVTAEPLAHLDETGRPHLLVEHLEAVGERAAAYAERFGAAEWARRCGLWHDLGKYAADFQAMIRAANGFEAHLEAGARGQVDHSSAGAIHALEALGNPGLVIAFAIAGHHAGLPDRVALLERLQQKRHRLAEAKAGGAPERLLRAAPLAPPAALASGTPAERKRRVELWIRMLFSALCDADFLDTEAFFSSDRAALRGHGPAIPVLRERLTEHLTRLQAGARSSEVNRVRAEVLAACRAAAASPPGAFSLTVPTGGGKTLASMAFALEHAARHGLERVIVAIPFTSIIEQTSGVLRDALGEEAVVEHHSAFDPARETPQNRVACENWDAPVVVTTTVQLFESLFAARPSACRKLHRLARSAIVLDEAQTLPPGLLAPILDALQALLRDYGATVVISTATQPALGRAQGLPVGLDAVQEIVPPSVRAFARLRRVRVRWPAVDEPLPYPALAQELAGERDVMAIVHLRHDARVLCQALDAALGHAQTLHLSALMCPEHRSQVLAAIKERKRRGEPVRLVATQLVEAGVDLDFAVVYRALGGIDALAQAAGRCNREGLLEGPGELRVFRAPTEPPLGVPRTALAITRGMLRADPDLDLFAPEAPRRYFQQLYGAKDLDHHQVQEAREELAFQRVAERFRLIEDAWSAPLMIPFDARAKACLAELERFGPSRARLRLLQRYTVTVPRSARGRWLDAGIAREVAETVVALGEPFMAAYDRDRFGLVPERLGAADAASLVIDDFTSG